MLWFISFYCWHVHIFPCNYLMLHVLQIKHVVSGILEHICYLDHRKQLNSLMNLWDYFSPGFHNTICQLLKLLNQVAWKRFGLVKKFLWSGWLKAKFLLRVLSYSLNLTFCSVEANFFIHYLEERVKVPWPVSEREALLHYFQFEYLKEDLVIVIMKTVRRLIFIVANLFLQPW